MIGDHIAGDAASRCRPNLDAGLNLIADRSLSADHIAGDRAVTDGPGAGKAGLAILAYQAAGDHEVGVLAPDRHAADRRAGNVGDLRGVERTGTAAEEDAGQESHRGTVET